MTKILFRTLLKVSNFRRLSVCCKGYGVAKIRRLLTITGLFCKIALSKRRYSAKETYHFKEPTTRRHPIPARYDPYCFWKFWNQQKWLYLGPVQSTNMDLSEYLFIHVHTRICIHMQCPLWYRSWRRVCLYMEMHMNLPIYTCSSTNLADTYEFFLLLVNTQLTRPHTDMWSLWLISSSKL